MKNIGLFMILILLFSSNCSSQTKTTENIEKIELSERTRGHQRFITITSNLQDIAINDKTSKEKTDPKIWKKINKTSKSLNLNNISKLVAPANKRFHDAAMMSQITITAKGKKYVSIPFDSGNPPKELKEIYQILFSQFDLSEFN